MRTAPPQAGGRAGDKAVSEDQQRSLSTAVASPVQASIDVPPVWRRLDSVVADLLIELAPKSEAA